MTERRALVIGATGITGRNAAEHLARTGWDVVGVSRKPGEDKRRCAPPRGRHLRPRLDRCGRRPGPADPRLLQHVVPAGHRGAQHRGQRRDAPQRPGGARARPEPWSTSALVTGLKHYLGPFEAYAQNPAKPPFRESQPRLDHENFYYTQEDILFDAADRFGFTWSVHRPAHGHRLRARQRHEHGRHPRRLRDALPRDRRPVRLPRLTGAVRRHHRHHRRAATWPKHLAWAATAPEARNEAFNVTNGDTFHWRQMWEVVASGLGVEAAPYPGHPTPLDDRMGDAASTWRRDRRAGGAGGARRRQARVLVAQRQRPRPNRRDPCRHGQEPGSRLHRGHRTAASPSSTSSTGCATSASSPQEGSTS